MPLIGFRFAEDFPFEPAEDITERLDEAAAAIPRAILILRKLALLRMAQADAEGEIAIVGDPTQCRDHLGR